MLVSELIKSALRLINVPGKGATLSPGETQEAFEVLKHMVWDWGISSLSSQTVEKQFYPLIGGQYEYRIGFGVDGADLDVDRFISPVPYAIVDAFIRKGGTVSAYGNVNQRFKSQYANTATELDDWNVSPDTTRWSFSDNKANWSGALDADGILFLSTQDPMISNTFTQEAGSTFQLEIKIDTCDDAKVTVLLDNSGQSFSYTAAGTYRETITTKETSSTVIVRTEVETQNGRGYQVVDVGSNKTTASATGLANDATEYTATIAVDGGTAQALTIVGSTAQTYATLLSQIASQVTGLASGTAALTNNGDLYIISNSFGTSSSISITDTDLFSTLTDYAAINTAVAGIGGDETAHTVKVDHVKFYNRNKRSVYRLDDSGYDCDLEIIDNRTYNRLINKWNGTGLPDYLYYERDYPMPVIRFDCPPENGDILVIDVIKNDLIPDTVDEELRIHREHLRCVRYNLAVEMAPEYEEANLPKYVTDTAKHTLSKLKSGNKRKVNNRVDKALLRRGGNAYNINKGW